MNDQPKTWQEIAAAVCEGGRARDMLEVGELWNAIEEMSDRIEVLEEREKDVDRRRDMWIASRDLWQKRYVCLRSAVSETLGREGDIDSLELS